MAVPVSQFTYSLNLLQVSFYDNSISNPNPTAWSWDFGDSNTSNSQNPVHTYATAGTYDVSLEVTNADGSHTSVRQIIVVTSAPSQFSVAEMIQADLPEGLGIDPNSQSLWTRKWQLYLQVLVDPHIPDADVHNDTAWPALVNALIAKLVVHDAFSRASQGAMVLTLQGAGNSQESTIAAGSAAGSQQKSVETGPTKVEWFDVADTINSMLRKGGGEQGSTIFDLLRQECCRLASRLRIKLAMCDHLEENTIIPIKAEIPANKGNHRIEDYKHPSQG